MKTEVEIILVLYSLGYIMYYAYQRRKKNKLWKAALRFYVNSKYQKKRKQYA